MCYLKNNFSEIINKNLQKQMYAIANYLNGVVRFERTNPKSRAEIGLRKM